MTLDSSASTAQATAEKSNPAAVKPGPREPKRIVSGMRPTGKLHVGHLQGAVKNWIALSARTDCYFFSADWHALTTDYADPSKIEASTKDMFADWIAAGLDPERVTLFVQSRVKQHAELFLLLAMIAPLGWLERVPTFKELQEQLREKDLATLGFLGYPVLQTADVALYDADAVPVGQDQVSHLELAREIVRRFNFLFGQSKPVLVEPQAYLTEVPKILGLDGRKMSKSYGNAIELGEDPASARQRVMVAVTDPARKRRTDPGTPEICCIYWLHRSYSRKERVAQVESECRSAAIGCVDCKKLMLEGLVPALEQHRARRAELDRNPARLEELVQLGTRKAAAVAETTMVRVRGAMRLG